MNLGYCVGLNLGWKKMRFKLALNKTFYPTLQPLIHWQLKQRQRTKINKTVLSASPPSPSHRFSTISKTNTYSILTVNKLPVLEISSRISKFYAPADFEHKFNKTEIENSLPIRQNLGLSLLTTCSQNHYTMLIH